MNVTIYPAEFEEQVRECLANLYDFTMLQSNPLVQRLAPDLPGTRQVQAARQIIIDKIEALKLKDEAGYRSKQTRPYHILMLRYVDEAPVQEIMHQLALSHRQFYREHRRALEALSQILWLYVSQPADPQGHPSITLESEIQRAYTQHPEANKRSDIDNLILGAIQAVEKLAEQHHVHIDLEKLDQDTAFVRISQLLLRQCLIWLLSQVVKVANDDGKLTICYELSDNLLQIHLFGLSPTTSPLLMQHIMADETWQHFAQSLSLRCLQATDDDPDFTLLVPYEEHTILVIDDNPDVVDLFRRYAAASGYNVIGAASGREGLAIAQTSEPSLIILDVMLPEQDGWETLQRLKGHTTLRNIPVFVCSVLETPDLALSLGARGFLKKPPNQLAFLSLLDQNTASTD